MRIPVIRGLIDRRILANFRVEPDVMARILPAPFRPKLAGGYAVGGICLIRLVGIRPRFLPLRIGLRSENAAHRVAVEWDSGGKTHEGVYIPRRDTNSRLNTWAGGTIFPGLHHHAKFDVRETADELSVSMISDDGKARVKVSGTVTDRLPTASVFSSLKAASNFFELGSLGYSPTTSEGLYDGLELRCEHWHVDALDVDHIESSFFQDETRFPRGSVTFDCALLMRGIPHEWHGRDHLCCPAPAGA